MRSGSAERVLETAIRPPALYRGKTYFHLLTEGEVEINAGERIVDWTNKKPER